MTLEEREAMTPDEFRKLFRRELQRARLAQRTEEVYAIEEGLENRIAAALDSSIEAEKAANRRLEALEPFLRHRGPRPHRNDPRFDNLDKIWHGRDCTCGLDAALTDRSQPEKQD